jgi:sugar/nucleoside kinase (ribokinase family)
MIGMEKSYFGEIRLNLEVIQPEDLVVWPIWRTGMKEDFQLVKEKGCATIVGLGALSEEIEADIAVGSQWELPKDFKPEDFLNKFPRIIATDNENGAIEYTAEGVITQPALPANVVDTTGAGDGFVCGVVKSFVQGKSGTEALSIAATWAAKTVESSSSVPPAWN